MIKTEWSCLNGHVLDSRFRIEQLLKPIGDGALFRAIDIAAGQECLVRLQHREASCGQIYLNRFREAQYLDHPNLLRVIASGETQYGALPFMYLTTELASSPLSETTDGQPLTLDEVSDAVRQIAAGLQYLHSENLIYCALEAESIWRVGDRWKLADYGELRVPGKYPSRETRRLLLSSILNAPPEANEGLVSEAWDVWSLGSVVRKLLLNRKQLNSMVNGVGRPASWSTLSVPYPYSEILRNALEPSPSDRATLQQTVGLLSASSGDLAPNAATVATVRDSPQTASNTAETSTGPYLPEPALLAYEKKIEGAPVESFFEPKQGSRPVELPHFLVTRPRGNGRKIATGMALVAALSILSLFFFSRYPQFHLGVPRASNGSLVKASLKSVRKEPVGTKHNQAYENDGVTTAPQSEAQQEVSALLNEWVSSTRNRDVDAKVQCYAPLVDRYYGQRKVSSSRLHEQVEDVFSRIGTVRKFDVRNVQFARLGPEWAVVSFDNEWKFGSNRPFEGSVRDELVLRPVEGRWKITGQRELKVYWTNR